MHFPAWYRAERGGLVDFNFADFISPMARYRKETDRALPSTWPGTHRVRVAGERRGRTTTISSSRRASTSRTRSSRTSGLRRARATQRLVVAVSKHRARTRRIQAAVERSTRVPQPEVRCAMTASEPPNGRDKPAAISSSSRRMIAPRTELRILGSSNSEYCEASRFARRALERYMTGSSVHTKDVQKRISKPLRRSRSSSSAREYLRL